MARGSQRVFLHIGLPKTGTTFIQSVLSASRKDLRDQGVLFPWPTGSHFWAAQDLTEHLFMGQENPRVAGSWSRLARKVRRGPAASVVSHELFTLATAQQVQRAASDVAPAELHVILTVRDFERQLPAVWQERLKNGGRISFDRHFEQAVEKEATRQGEPAGFWRQQDAVGILRRWAQTVPRDRIHVITIPQPGAPGDTLWRRFAGVVGFDPDVIDLTTVQATGNVSLRPPQAKLLRRINTRLQDSLPPAVYRSVVKGYLTESASTTPIASATYGLTPDQRRTARRWSEELREEIASGGYMVVGDPAELVAVAPAGGVGDLGFDEVPANEESAAAVASAAALVQWMAQPPDTGGKPLRALAEQLRTRS